MERGARDSKLDGNPVERRDLEREYPRFLDTVFILHRL